MPVKIEISETGLKVKVDNAWKAGLAQLSSQILKDCNRYCKEDQEGILIASSLIHSQLKDGKLIWQTPYAARQYYEIRTAYKDYNPNASWRWCEVAKANHGERWLKQARKVFGENL